MPPQPPSAPSDDLAEASARLVRTVDALPGDAFAQPSLLPGWSRAHVVAHVALNAEALAGVLRGIADGEEVPMYPSQEQRDADVEELAAEEPAAIRDRLLASTTTFADAWAEVPDDAWTGTFPRLPDGPQLPRGAIGDMRLGEVEIHHADLGLDYTVNHWPPAFRDATFERVVRDRAEGAAMLLRTPQGDVQVGEGTGPTVTGSRTDLTWWLLGRGDGEGLAGDPELPELGRWR